MRLASVRSLKQELLSSPIALIEAVPVARVAALRTRTQMARKRLGASGMSGLALGAIRTSATDFRLAIRQQESGPLVDLMTEEIRKRAKNEVDVKFVGKLVSYAAQNRPAFYRATRRPLRIGSSISDVQSGFVSAGTLGCFVAGREAPYWVCLLTNNHVIADENGNRSGDPVVQEGTLDGGTKADNLVAELWKYIRLRKTGTNTVDAAVGAIYDDIDIDELTIGTLGNLKGLGNVTRLAEKAVVHKVGRTTGQTKGRVTAFDIDNVKVDFGIGELRFDGQIEIEGTGNKAFSDSGDSGSLIVDSKRRAIGLLFAGGNSGGSNGKGLTYANPIQTILDALELDLLF